MEEKIENLFKYMNNYQKYSEKLKISIKNQLWEYSTVLIWKLIIVFIYEKLYQINYIGKDIPEDFKRQLDKENIKIRLYTDFCILKDDNINTQLNKIWKNVAKNYSNIFKSLLDERNGLSHVNEYEDKFTLNYFENHLDKALQLLDFLQDKHNNDYLDEIFKEISLNSNLKYLSEMDISYYLDNKDLDNEKVFEYVLNNILELNYSNLLNNKIKLHFISSFTNSSSFAETCSYFMILEKLIPHFSENDFSLLLKGIFENQGTYNQIIPTKKIEDLLILLFNFSTNFENLEEVWLEFLLKLNYFNVNSENKFEELNNIYEEFFGMLPRPDLIQVILEDSNKVVIQILDPEGNELTRLNPSLDEFDSSKIREEIFDFIKCSNKNYFLQDLTCENIVFPSEYGKEIFQN